MAPRREVQLADTTRVQRGANSLAWAFQPTASDRVSRHETIPLLARRCNLSISGTISTLTCFVAVHLCTCQRGECGSLFEPAGSPYRPGAGLLCYLSCLEKESVARNSMHANDAVEGVTWTKSHMYIRAEGACRFRCLASPSPAHSIHQRPSPNAHESADLRRGHHPDYFYPSTPPCPWFLEHHAPSFRPT